MKHRTRVVFCLLTVLLLVGSAAAQIGTSRITGTVTDKTGAVIPDAKVTATNEETKVDYVTKTTTAGTYEFASMPVGNYTITVEIAGFQKYVSRKNVVSVGAPSVIDPVMEVGAVTQTVEVESTFERLDTTNATMGGVVSRKEIVELPLNGRNPLNLIIFEPGLVQRSSGAAGSGTHVFGSRDRAHNVTIDGIDANESSVPNPQSNIYRLTPDNVQEYRVVTHNATAEFGRNSGANVAISTRQGTNEFHGDIYYFHRNTVLNSFEFYSKAQAQISKTQPAKPVILLHQFGGDVGGPIIKDKTFFFFSYQGNRIKQAQPITQSFGIPLVYTSAIKSGIFRYVRGPITFTPPGGSTVTVNQNDRRLIDPATGNILAGVPICTGVLGGTVTPTATAGCIDGFNFFAADPAGIGANADMLAMINSFPLPNSFSSVGDGLNTGGFLWNTPSNFKGPFYRARVDHKFNDSHSIFGSFNWSRYDTKNGDLLNSRPRLFPGFSPLGEVNRDTQLLSLSYRAALSPRMVNELTAGYSRFNFFFSLNESNGVSGTLAAIGQECFGTDSLSNIDTPFCNTPHTQRAVSTVQLIDNFSFNTGAHSIRAGINFRFYRHNDSRGVPGGFNMSPTIVFAQGTRNPSSGNTAPGNTTAFPDPAALTSSTVAGINTTDRGTYRQAVVEFLGIPARVQQVFQANLSGDQFTTDLFTLGTRIRHYDFYLQDEWKVKRNLTVTAGFRWEFKPPATDCCDRVFVPDRDLLGSAGPVTFQASDSWWNRNNWNTIAPRVSLAWQPRQDGKTVVRAGYSMAFDTISSFQVTSVGGKIPGGTLQCFTTVPVGTSPAAPPSGCADIRSIVPANARLPEILAALGSGGGVALPLPTSLPSQSFSPTARQASSAPGVGAFDPNIKVPTIHEWNLTIQRELPWNLVAQVGYIGKRGTRLYRAYDLNQIFTDQPGFLPDFMQARLNVGLGCDADGTAAGSSTALCAAVGAARPTLLYQLAGCGAAAATCAFVNGRSADFTNNSLGGFAANLNSNVDIAANGFSAGYFRPNPQFNEIFYFDSGGSSIYHGMIAQVNRRFAKGVTFGFAYTLSKSIDDMSVDPVAATSGGALGNNSRTPTDVRNFALDRTVSDFDSRHTLSGNALIELPFGKGRAWANSQPAWLDHIIGGWTLTGVITAQGGEPFTLNSGSLTVTSTAAGKQSTLDVRGPMVQPGEFQVANVAGPSVYNLGPRITNFSDPNFNCRNVLKPDGQPSQTFFCIPLPGQHGNTGRNAVRGPGFWNVDAGILKNFRVTERIGMQFRTEFFNAFNHANIRNPRNASTGSPTLTSSLFGQTCCISDSVPSSQTIVAVGEPNRVIQFALKISF